MAGTAYPAFLGQRSTGTRASKTIPANGDIITSVHGRSWGGSSYDLGAQINMTLDGTPGDGDTPTAITFMTSPDGSSSPAERVRITSAGNVGIGTTTPGHKLDVVGAGHLKGDGTNDALWLNATDGAIELSREGGGAYIDFRDLLADDHDVRIQEVSNGLLFRTGGNGSGTDSMSISSSGNVGIGTTTPVSQLSLVGSSNTMTVQNDANNQFGFEFDLKKNRAGSALQQGDTIAAFDYRGYDGTQYLRAAFTAAIIDATPGTNDMPTALTFSTTPDGGVTSLERMRISNSGNVGIGTTSPGVQLDVEDSSIVGNGDIAHFLSPSAADDNYLVMKLGKSTATGGAGILGIHHNVGTPADSYMFLSVQGDSGDGGTGLIVKKGGNVGIGTTSPSHKLHVIGTAGLSTGTAWTNTSDIRLKDIRGKYEHGLDAVMKLNTVRFNYKQGNELGLPSDQEIVGFIAQEVEKVIPEAVVERDDGFLELNVDPIHWALVNATQEQQEIINRNLEMVKLMQNGVQNNSRRIASLEADNKLIMAENKEMADKLINVENENKKIKKQLESIKSIVCSIKTDADICR